MPARAMSARPAPLRNVPNYWKRIVMNKTTLSIFAALFLSGVAGSTIAGEVPASFDAKNCKVDYPKASLMNEEQGTTSMSFLINPDGSVADSKVEKSSGFKGLDKAAIKSLSACKFKPGTKDGAPAQTWTKVDYAWKLD
jgi:protein TonB